MLRWCLVILLLHAWNAHGEEVEGSSEDSPGSPIVIDRIISFPEYGFTDTVLLRNTGKEAVDLRGWWLADSKNDKNDVERSYLFATKEGCEAYSGIPAGGVMELTPLRKANPCGFPFGVSIEDALNLYNANGELVAHASWDWSQQGLALRRMPDGSYERMRENHSVKRILEDYPDLYLFRDALWATGLMEDLKAENGEKVFPEIPFDSINDANPHQLPASMGVKASSSKWPVKYDKMSFDGVPSDGPYTVLAPTSQALKDFLENWGPGKGLSREEIFKLPEFKKVMEAHIIPGSWMTGLIFHDTELGTSSGVSIVALKDSEHSDGKLKFQPVCDDKPAPGDYTCADQLEFGKCGRAFVTGSGYCLRTCNACGCADGQCAEAVHSDLYASNGMVHVVNKVVAPGATSSSPKAPVNGDADADLETKSAGEDAKNSEDIDDIEEVGETPIQEASTPVAEASDEPVETPPSPLQSGAEAVISSRGSASTSVVSNSSSTTVRSAGDEDESDEDASEDEDEDEDEESEEPVISSSSSIVSSTSSTTVRSARDEDESDEDASEDEDEDEDEESENPVISSRTSIVSSSSIRSAKDEDESDEDASEDEDEDEESEKPIISSSTSVVSSSSRSSSIVSSTTSRTAREEEEEDEEDEEDEDEADKDEDEDEEESEGSTAAVVSSRSSARSSVISSSSSVVSSSTVGTKDSDEDDSEEEEDEEISGDEAKEDEEDIFSRTSSTDSDDGVSISSTSIPRVSGSGVPGSRRKTVKPRESSEDTTASSGPVALSWSSSTSTTPDKRRSRNNKPSPVSRTG